MNISLDQLKAIGAIVATVLTGAIVIWWLVIVAQKLGVKAEVKNGNVVLDQYGRAKDILLVVLPLFSAALAYWVGSSGTQEAKNEAAGAKQQLDAVIDTAPEGTLQRAKELHRDAWGST
jgi:chloramphenicol 3-O-phosphotransferase